MSFEMKVKVTSLTGGGVDAAHGFATRADKEAADALPSQGVYHIAHALLLEALRRETYLSALGHISQEPAYLKRYTEADEAGKRDMEKGLSGTVMQVLQKGIGKLAPGTARGVFEMLTTPLGGANPPPRGANPPPPE